MIRILHVIDHLGLGGAQTALLNLLKHRDTKNFEHTVSCLHGHGAVTREFESLGVRVISLSPHRWPPLYLPRLWQLLGRERFDIVHCHLFGSNWIAKPLAWLRGKRIFFNHDQCNDALRIDNPLALALDRATNRLSKKIFAVSHSTADFLQHREGIPAERIVYFPNGVDTRAFPSPTAQQKREARERFRLPLDAFLIGGAGRLAPQKDFATFLKAASLLCPENPSLHFVIFGTGAEEAALMKLAIDLGVKDRVTFAGYTTERALIYQAIDVFFLTSLYEGTPLVLLEAMAAHVPIVASAVDGTAEILENGVSARLFPAQDAQAAAKALASLVNDVGLRSQLSEAAATKVTSHYDAQALMQRLEGFYFQETKDKKSAPHDISH